MGNHIGEWTHSFTEREPEKEIILVCDKKLPFKICLNLL